MKPWGPIDWLLSKTGDTSASFYLLGCIAAEERCQKIPLLAKSLGTPSVRLLRIDDPVSHYVVYHKEKVLNNEKALKKGGLNQWDQINIKLEASDDEIAQTLNNFLPSGNTEKPITLWIDISCMPKRFFFLLIKLALRHPTIDNLLATYTQPRPGHYTVDRLAEDPGPVKELPGFGVMGEEPKTLVVAVGFESLGLSQLIDEFKDKDYRIIVLLPFPPGQPYSRRIWETVHDVGVEVSEPLIKRVDAIDALGTQQLLLETLQDSNPTNPAGLAPYGPKPVSLGMCLYAIQTGSPVFYTQPRVYHPDYTIGIGESWGYYLKLRGGEVWKC
ncbi:hypothetical protein PJI16_03860 [Nitrospira sp. MA-1]|nr:hypothetical protein [Nitrospira sp. MA-1]